METRNCSWLCWLENHKTGADNVTQPVVPEKTMAFAMGTEDADQVRNSSLYGKIVQDL